MQDQQGLLAGVYSLLAGVMGSILGMMNDFSLTTRGQKASFFATGIISSLYLTDFVVELLKHRFPTILDDDKILHPFGNVVAFLVGLFAAQLIQATYKVIKSGSVVGQIFSVIKGRLGL